MTDSQIVKFFENQTVLITGGTGYLGKVLIEKLLRVCLGLKMIYVIVRPKKGKTPQERFDEMFNYPCFDNLKTMKIDYKSRVQLILGDCAKPHLGLNLADQDTLKAEVSCVIHAAASVKFEQPLRKAVENNVKPLQAALDLAKGMPNLKAFVHVSTAFSNCIHFHIKEEFYEPPMTLNALFGLLEISDDETLEKITPFILQKWPNTYVFSKAIAENILKTEGQGLPVTLVRPPIVSSALKEPVIGWIDNFYGVVGITVAGALGVLRTLHADPECKAWCAPVDMVSNAVLAAAWNVGTQRPDPDQQIPVFNAIISKTNVLNFGGIRDYADNCARDYASVKVVWHFSFKMEKSYRWNTIRMFFLHTVPAYIADSVLFCLGKPTLAVKNYERLHKLIKPISYFATNSWDFDIYNLRKLWGKMGEVDQELFNFNGDNFDYREYIRNSIRGGRVFLLKDPMETLPQGKIRLKMLMVAHYTVLTIMYYLLYKLLVFLFGQMI